MSRKDQGVEIAIYLLLESTHYCPVRPELITVTASPAS